ncbi:hypothetical protein MVEG_03901 [Podila verticillata NRRL 6337]|nr:hypothetical protein MVEG_03901 [Podila verticillata NRRL 6337]
MSHQRANSTSFVSNAFGGVSNTTPDMPPSDPRSISNPRQRSFSSSFSLATSPRTFTGSSIISNPSNPLLGYGPASPTTAPSSFGGSNSTAQTMPVLHRRFSSSFNQLNQIVSPPTGGAQNDRGRRTSLFGGSGSSPPMSMPPVATSQAENSGGLFRKFSTSGRSNGHPFDRNETDPVGGLAPQPNLATSNGGNNNGPVGGVHLTAVDKLKPPHDNRHSRSNSPMRSLILGGQMLD